MAATVGAVAFGLFLFYPAFAAFEDLGKLGVGSWLGVCSGLIPLGAGVAYFTTRGRPAGRAPAPAWAAGVGAIGLVLVVIGIWEKLAHYDWFGGSYWNFSSSRPSAHAIGILILLLAIVIGLSIAAAVFSRSAVAADIALVFSGLLAGFVASSLLVVLRWWSSRMLGTGVWLELAGGIVLLVGAIAMCVTIAVRAPATGVMVGSGAYFCRCGAQVPAGAKFCGVCGQPIRSEPTPTQCAHCGHPVTEADRFCRGCGQPLG